MIVITWRLVSFAADEQIFTVRPLRLVTLLAILPFIATGLLLVAFVALSFLRLTPAGDHVRPDRIDRAFCGAGTRPRRDALAPNSGDDAGR